jgi:hypothetical protein
MSSTSIAKAKNKTKTAAVTAAGSFFMANPMISAFLIGVGAVIYLTWRARSA